MNVHTRTNPFGASIQELNQAKREKQKLPASFRSDNSRVPVSPGEKEIETKP